MHIKNIEVTDEMTPKQPRVTLNFVSSMFQDFDSKEFEIELRHSCQKSEYEFYAKTILIEDDFDDTSSVGAEKKSMASDDE